LSTGAATPTLVLLPGLDGTGKLFAGFAEVLRPDLPSLIVSYPKDQVLGYEELETRVLAALPSAAPFVLLGESFSGPLAIRIAARAPPGLIALILCASFAKNPYPWARWMRPLAAYLPLRSLPRWLRAPLMWGSASPAQAPAQADRAMAGVSPAVIRHRIAALLAVDETAALRRILLPTLVLAASRDRVIPAGAARWMLRALPHARLVRIDGPHLLLQTRPAACAAAVLEFVHSWSASSTRAP
jgi:pimeloyl-[acyl-carrier protein] methyl ester esterase